MVRRKDPFWKYVKVLENGRFSCNFCGRDFAGGISKIKAHLSGVRGRNIQICENVPQTIQPQSRDASPPTKRAKNVVVSNNILEGESLSGSSSLHIPNLCEGQDKSTVDQQLVKFLMSERIRPGAINSPFFINFVNGVAEHGPGYKQPHWLTIESELMPNIKKEVEKYVENVINESSKTGCTILIKMSERLKCELVLEIFAYTRIGIACIKTFMYSEDDCYLETALSSIFKSIEPRNVVQFIGSGYPPFIKNELSNYHGIYVTDRVNDDIEYLVQEMQSIQIVDNIIAVAKLIVLYIYKYKVKNVLRRVYKKNADFASDVFMLISLIEVESELQTLHVSIGTLSDEWGKPLNDPHVAKFIQETKFIDYAIHSKEFWRRGKIVAQVMHALVQSRCLVCHGGPTIGYLYEMMERVKDAVGQCRDINVELYDDIGTILRQLRSDNIHPIHAAAAFLSPIYMCSEKFEKNEEMKNAVNHILEQFVVEEEKENFRNEEQLYRMKDANLFTAEAMLMLKTYHPRKFSEFFFFFFGKTYIFVLFF